MNKVIIYKQDNGNVAVVVPTAEALASHTVAEIALKDVPAGKAFKIVDAAELPVSVPMEAWEVAEEDLTDGVGGESNEFN